MSNIISYLFETNAIKFCEEGKPFWYTSGKIGPYFINTHFVYGSEEKATEFLSSIDNALNDKNTLPEKIYKQVYNQYNTNNIYKNVIDEMKSFIETKIDINSIDYISGGERRDWFFSNILAHLLNKPHITIFKDLTTLVSDSNFENTHAVSLLENKNVLHVTDLITVASSFIRAWIPAIKELKATMCFALSVVDRMQGGKDYLKKEGVESFSLVNVDKSLFNKANELNIINKSQVKLLNDFFENPDETMRNFLIENPNFIDEALKSDEKTAKRAKLLLDGNLYNL